MASNHATATRQIVTTSPCHFRPIDPIMAGVLDEADNAKETAAVNRYTDAHRMMPHIEGAWVKFSDIQAEIERLKGEKSLLASENAALAERLEAYERPATTLCEVCERAEECPSAATEKPAPELHPEICGALVQTYLLTGRPERVEHSRADFYMNIVSWLRFHGHLKG